MAHAESAAGPVQTHKSPPLEISASRYFTQWLSAENISLACTTYQTSRLLLLGAKPPGDRLSVFERLFDRAMGLYASTDRLYLSTRYQLWQFDNMLWPGQLHEGYDKLYVPRIGHTTGDLDIHDVAVDSEGRVVFACTALNALATLSDRYSCTPLWRPPFVSRTVAEDRCHLNGLALRDGRPAYMTAVGRSDVIDGWREHRRDGGCVVDVASGETLVSGLSMPHSPRWHNDRLWVLDSGRGEFGFVDLEQGRFEPLVFCPGYARGLAFCGNYAVVGLSRPRDKTFSGLELDERLAERKTEPRCGLLVIDLATGTIAHWVRFEGVVAELYDVAVLPGVRRPMALGFKTDEIARMVQIPPDGRSGITLQNG